ncbi:hypothetical protein CHS0354_027543 [Potamilus streckersoni]|uniref:Uncharacterized protein n=1 Tax=Potamilus streckersoni TaxID=2493646 RepID=A0AAE0VM98_9BIVA|nr:hypothetical protein CHS0354_027543 [Potamilus streckersoni]
MIALPVQCYLEELPNLLTDAKKNLMLHEENAVLKISLAHFVDIVTFLGRELFRRSARAITIHPAPGAHAGYNPDGTLAWENQHMQMGTHRMPGADMYDPMKAGYHHMDGSQRYDMFGMQGMHGGDMYAAPPVSSSYSQMSQFRSHASNAMLIPGHPHHMMMGHGAHAMSPHGMAISSAQSPPLHGSMDGMSGHIQDIHAG